jgi:DNA recombination protein RmuC
LETTLAILMLAGMAVLLLLLLGQQMRLRVDLADRLSELREGFERRQAETRASLQQGLDLGSAQLEQRLRGDLSRQAQEFSRGLESLTRSVDHRLGEISGRVEQRVSEGFAGAQKTFTAVHERLAMVDDARQKIAELTTNVVSLERLLADRTARGALGEAQLHALVGNILPESAYELEYSLGNGRRVDCMLLLPPPSGPLAIDAKFPLDNYRRQVDTALPDSERAAAAKSFARDVRKHIDDVADRYIIPGETALGAVLFLPAETVFAEIHGRHPELVERAGSKRVWLASPTTLMAILTTAAGVLKDMRMQQQTHLLHDHLRKLSQEFARFQTRMQALANHMDRAQRDVTEIHATAEKIAGRFQTIEALEPAQSATAEESYAG